MASYDIEEHIPSSYLPLIKCSLLEEDETGQSIMTIITSSGELLEFSRQKYINGCEIESVDAKLLKSFISYDPLKKYYLILTLSQLIVILRQKEMKIFKTFENVIDIEIKDQLCLGRPQILMKIRDQEDPYITDLVGTLKVSETKVQSQINLNLHSKLQESVVRLEKAKQLLQEKKTCRINSWLEFTQQTGESSITSGIIRTNNLDHIPTSKIEIFPTWQRVFCRRWILGIPIKNISQSSCTRHYV
uniref:Uncharacterized protein n=1 Tax=Clastoptera arizonana TaxID=38151 RepID=A0A1B6CR98_9HEMI